MTLDATILAGLRQPDQTSCGASVLVAARMLLDPAYAETVRHRGFAPEVLAVHREVTGPLTVEGHLQVPWPRALGTPPWAVASELSAYGTRYAVRLARLSPAAPLAAAHVAVAADQPVPIFVGDTWLARHVVLAVGPTDGGLDVYDPAAGAVVPVADQDVTTARLRLSGWSRAWFLLLPT